MSWLIAKYAVTATIIVLVSEIAKRSDKLGAFIVALPLVTILAMIWMHIEKQPLDKISNHAWYTFWYVIPTLPMFLLIPILLPKFGFWLSLVCACIVTMLIFGLFGLATRLFGIELW